LGVGATTGAGFAAVVFGRCCGFTVRGAALFAAVPDVLQLSLNE
jgi:hypothetical protein